jgi:hypothetical protein
LCGDKYRILLNYVKGAFFKFFLEVAGALHEKRDQLALISFYTLCCGWLVGIKKEPNFRCVLFIPWKGLKKKVQQKLNLFYTACMRLKKAQLCG